MATAATRKRTTSFWARVDQTPTCWLWRRPVDRCGYGYLKWKVTDPHGRHQYQHQQAHRRAYEELVGPIPGGMELHHRCGVRNCVNPDHLEPATHRENSRRGLGVSGRNARKTRCAHGHPFDEANTYWWRGARHCRACNRGAAATVRRTRWKVGLSKLSRQTHVTKASRTVRIAQAQGGCLQCHDAEAVWQGEDADKHAGRHARETGHETWADQIREIRYDPAGQALSRGER